MTHVNFINNLKKNMPDKKELKNLEYSVEEINKIEASYLLKETDNKTNLYPELNELGWLFSKYRINDLEVGMISFLDKPIPIKNGIQIGKVEADKLILSVNDFSVTVQENGEENILWKCAENINNFLSALSVMCEHFSKTMINSNLYDDFNYLEKVASKAGDEAGGVKYISFYRMLLGI